MTWGEKVKCSPLSNLGVCGRLQTFEDELDAFRPCFRRRVLDLNMWGGSKTTSIRSRHERRMQVNFIRVLLALDEHLLCLIGFKC
jgi:hypothetical protein